VSRYRISRHAREDLDAIWDYIARRSSADTATNFLWRFYETFRSIASSPAAGVVVPDLEPQGIRKFPMGNYLIYYKAGGRNSILIIRVLHGKRLQRRAYYWRGE
jgi:toxin ParE1/3/4